MNLIYIANVRMPTERAHGIQIAKMCEAFALQDFDVTLLVPKRRNTILEAPWSYYGVRKNFSISWLPSLDTVRFGRIGFLIQALTFSVCAAWHVWRHTKPGDIIYSRDELPLAIVSFFRRTFVWEAHRGTVNVLVRRLLGVCKRVVVISEGLKVRYRELGVPEERLVLAPDGVDDSFLEFDASKAACRQRLGIAGDEKLALYAGHLYSWKGAGVLADAAETLEKHGIVVMFVGGTDADIEAFRRTCGDRKNIRIVGRMPHAEIPSYLRAADVLVIPNTAESDISTRYTSPLKLFEYMASGTPIVASDLPALREVLSELTAFFVPPSDPEALAERIIEVFASYEQAIQAGAAARREAGAYAWRSRAARIIHFLEA
jgi:glycosyltransferase involved in cell wall biosynthesis